MLSKKYYIRFAEILRTVKAEHETLEQLQTRLEQYFREDNPRFDNWRFQKAARPD